MAQTLQADFGDVDVLLVDGYARGDAVGGNPTLDDFPVPTVSSGAWASTWLALAAWAAVVARDTSEQDLAARPQRFLTGQGCYEIVDSGDIVAEPAAP